MRPSCALRLCAALLALPLSANAAYDLDQLGVPRFIHTHYIDLSRIVQLSKFRSSAGHDYSDDVERCRSMKHYFIGPDASTAVLAPVSGTITAVQPEFAGSQLQIRPDAQPDFTVILFHVALNGPYAAGQRVVEGQALGQHAGRMTWSDVAIRVNTPGAMRHVSYIEALSDTAFAALQARGVGSRAELVISRAERDAAPFQCNGQSFINLPVPADTEFYTLVGTGAPQPGSWSQGPLQARQLQLSATLPPAVVGLTGGFFVAALLPPAMGSDIWAWSGGQWSLFSGCAAMPAAYLGPLSPTMSAPVVPVDTDLSAYAGTQLLVGYGIGSTARLACEAMLKGASYAPALTLN
ncbi:hypothetical protein [Inhella sp.]|uniref:hypothetical protein n=1 Tax=Inhella sp. TaxID=1921806 RepID=UPI0035B3F065